MKSNSKFGTACDCKVANDSGRPALRGGEGATNKVLNHHLRGWAADEGRGAGDDGNWEAKEAPEGGRGEEDSLEKARVG